MTQADDHPHAPTRLADVVLTIPEQRNQLFANTVEGNVRETILLASQFLCLAFFPSV